MEALNSLMVGYSKYVYDLVSGCELAQVCLAVSVSEMTYRAADGVERFKFGLGNVTRGISRGE